MTWPFAMVALIPARRDSKRIPGKNTKLLAGHPLLAYTIAAALQSRVFARVIVCSDIPFVDVPFSPACIYQSGIEWHDRDSVSDAQADIVWVRDVLGTFDSSRLCRQPDRLRHRTRPRPEAFAILRPTSPFRTADTIHRAFHVFTTPDQTADSIRAVQMCREHPGKMWTIEHGRLLPLLSYTRGDGIPWHSCPTQSLPQFYVQNSSLEMSWTANVEVHDTIHGRKVAPFRTEGHEGLTLDDPEDWAEAERLIASGEGRLPPLP
jgi:CMP-N,N'-diacetyllegionaminic acid synthase